jgi:1,4-dihydroxy-2-naphthoate octaprenyltransferase
MRITGPFPLVSWAAAPLALRPLRTVLREDGAILNRALGDTARLELVFCLLFAAGLLP